MRQRLLLIVCLFGLAACGQKGALYLPEQNPAAAEELEPEQTVESPVE